MSLTSWSEQASDTYRNLSAYAADFVRPTLRLGVTGLARSGKTIFITSLIHNLINHGRLPFFSPYAQGRIARAYLEPQPDDNIPRFAYEDYLSCLSQDPPIWPESTKRISQLRLTLEYEPESLFRRTFGQNQLSIDIVDYPGEWLLDLPILDQSFYEWSNSSIEMAKKPDRRPYAQDWLNALDEHRPSELEDEASAQKLAKLFTAYLKKCRDDEVSLSTLPPGRFLMPGDVQDSPMLTFSPLKLDTSTNTTEPGTLAAMMARRFESYKSHIARPFFTDHLARLDRQIVLVDVLQAWNAGSSALIDLQYALTNILKCFRQGRRTWLGQIFNRRIDKILFAATKADHIHHKNHDRLEAMLGEIVKNAKERAEYSGAEVKALALASIRSTKEAEAEQGGQKLPCIVGTPLEGERLADEIFDGRQEVAIFPGDIPKDPTQIFTEATKVQSRGNEDLRFIKFRPPQLAASFGSSGDAIPHIRLDQTLQFLLSDRLS